LYQQLVGEWTLLIEHELATATGSLTKAADLPSVWFKFCFWRLRKIVSLKPRRFDKSGVTSQKNKQR
jgi:hypothetical protein